MRNFNFDESKKTKIDSNVIAEGEVTGHFHKLESGKFDLYKSAEEECLLLKVLEPTILKHDEHHAIELLPGNYKESSINEYDHFKEECRIVRD
jgi:hypothetical protein